MAVNGDPGSPALRLHLEQYYLACPISNAPVESLLQLLKHGGGKYMELPALLQLMSLHTCKEAVKTVDVHDLQQRMGQLRAEVRRKEDATAAAQRSAKAERQITDATHKVGRVVINVGDHACQQRLAAAHALALGGHDYGHTTVEEAMKMTGKQLQSYLQFHKQEVHTSWRVPKLQSHVCTHIRGKLAAAAPPQQQLTPAGTTPELAEPAGAPPQQQQQLAAASTSRKRGAPAANKSRAAKQGATHNSVAKRASAARLALWAEVLPQPLQPLYQRTALIFESLGCEGRDALRYTNMMGTRLRDANGSLQALSIFLMVTVAAGPVRCFQPVTAVTAIGVSHQGIGRTQRALTQTSESVGPTLSRAYSALSLSPLGKAQPLGGLQGQGPALGVVGQQVLEAGGGPVRPVQQPEGQGRVGEQGEQQARQVVGLVPPGGPLEARGLLLLVGALEQQQQQGLAEGPPLSVWGHQAAG
ncbi:hypothetical protein QJQ45_018918 [Haematococcus lacustris]|nr:hypothetical protein QJQ45_018918 [Haematococcus lacustris]